MNILFLADVPLKDPTSGSEQVLYQQATGLDRDGNKVCAITRKDSGGLSIEMSNIGQIREGCYNADTGSILKFLLSLFKNPQVIIKEFSMNGKFDVIINHQPFTAFSLFLTKKLRSSPLIYVFHSPSYEEYLLLNEGKTGFKIHLQTMIRKIIEGFCLKRSRLVVVLSRYMKNKVESLYKISSDQIIVNPGGVDLNRFYSHKNREKLKLELRFPTGRVNLLTVRNLEKRMGIDNLIKCISILKEKMPDVFLTIGGSGEEKDRLESQIYENNLQGYITMTGYIPDEILPKYYAAADFFIIPTRKLEGFGLVTPESMACGTPVLGTPVGGTKEILSGFDPEFLFNDITPEAMADGITRIVEKYYRSNSYKILRSRCREYAEKYYSWDRHIDQLKSIIKEVVS
jgi:glycosyltransferase involved in cell wall biosynthesis